MRHGHYRRALRKYARCEGLGGHPGLPPFVGGAPLSRAGLAVLGRSGRLLGCPTEPPRCHLDHWITAAPLEVDLRRTAGHSRPPNRIDLLTSISGVPFEDAWAGRAQGELDGLPVLFIGRQALLVNKRASGRPKDLADIAKLTAIAAVRKPK